MAYGSLPSFEDDDDEKKKNIIFAFFRIRSAGNDRPRDENTKL